MLGHQGNRTVTVRKVFWGNYLGFAVATLVAQRIKSCYGCSPRWNSQSKDESLSQLVLQLLTLAELAITIAVTELGPF